MDTRKLQPAAHPRAGRKTLPFRLALLLFFVIERFDRNIHRSSRFDRSHPETLHAVGQQSGERRSGKAKDHVPTQRLPGPQSPSPPRTSPTIIRSGRCRRAAFSKSRTVTAGIPDCSRLVSNRTKLLLRMFNSEVSSMRRIRSSSGTKSPRSAAWSCRAGSTADQDILAVHYFVPQKPTVCALRVPLLIRIGHREMSCVEFGYR
jgi:hypothetical protein